MVHGDHLTKGAGPASSAGTFIQFLHHTSVCQTVSDNIFGGECKELLAWTVLTFALSMINSLARMETDKRTKGRRGNGFLWISERGINGCRKCRAVPLCLSFKICTHFCIFSSFPYFFFFEIDVAPSDLDLSM